VFCFLQPVYPHDLPEWTGFVPLVALTANAGYRCDLRRAVGALVVSLAGLTVLTTAEAALRSWDTYIFNAAIVVPAWAAARTLARHNERARQLASDLTKLAVEQAEREARAMAGERTRIARELHDVVAHSVTVLVIQVGSARMLIDNAPGRAQSRLLAAERSGREAPVSYDVCSACCDRAKQCPAPTRHPLRPSPHWTTSRLWLRRSGMLG